MTNTVREVIVEMEPVHRHSHPEPPPPYSQIDPGNNPIEEQEERRQTIILQPALRDVPIYYFCPSCHKNTLTSVEFVNSHKTHMIAGFVCGLTIWCLLCCFATVPYFVRKFKKADHYCSNCNYYLGSYSKL